MLSEAKDLCGYSRDATLEPGGRAATNTRFWQYYPIKHRS